MANWIAIIGVLILIAAVVVLLLYVFGVFAPKCTIDEDCKNSQFKYCNGSPQTPGKCVQCTSNGGCDSNSVCDEKINKCVPKVEP